MYNAPTLGTGAPEWKSRSQIASFINVEQQYAATKYDSAIYFDENRIRKGIA